VCQGPFTVRQVGGEKAHGCSVPPSRHVRDRRSRTRAVMRSPRVSTEVPYLKTDTVRGVTLGSESDARRGWRIVGAGPVGCG